MNQLRSDDAGDRGDRFEDGARLLREQKRDGGLAGARRPPQDHRIQSARRDHLAEQLAGAEQMLLADDLVERTRTHPIGERLGQRPPWAKESVIVVSLTPCHYGKASRSRSAGNAQNQPRRPVVPELKTNAFSETSMRFQTFPLWHTL